MFRIPLFLAFAWLLIACNPADFAPYLPPVPPTVAVVTPTPIATEIPILTPTPDAELAFLDKPPDTLRVLSYNINWDSIFPREQGGNHALRSYERVDEFRRIVKTIDPDVVCLQEINPNRKPQQVSDLLQEALAETGDEDTWQAIGRRDSFIVSRFDVMTEGYELVTPNFPLELAQAAALVNLPDEQYDRDMYVLCAHFKASGGYYDIILRQRQADVIMRQIGDANTSGDNLDLPPDTPMLIMGDFNIYDTDPAYHLVTLLTGDVVDEERYGPDVIPDWDGTDLADALPSHNGLGDETYTWRDDSGPFNPGPLDRIIYTDSALAIENAFVFDTTLLSSDALDALGLQAEDVILDSETGEWDHLPLVVDFRLIDRRGD
ncbi:MAG: endonuclease/exonuclease/phosphatase family protein [Caldilineales bacterium]|nr:endonuclease/exonuclease/phosphatase family protein [Caldilineales bacterium]